MIDAKLIARYEVVARCYASEYPAAPLALLTSDGRQVAGVHPCPACRDEPEFPAALGRESIRWGEAAISECPHGVCLWAVPVTDNNELVGSLLSGSVLPDDTNRVSHLSDAARRLCQLACKANLTNAALLACHAEQAAREADKAQAIHSLKGDMYHSVREVYLREEANLITAVETGEQRRAREVLNRILVGIYALGGQDFELLKALVLELVVVIYRTAVEAGGDPVELLGLNYSSLQEYAAIDDEEALTAWLVSHLERLMDSIRYRGERPVEVQLQVALRYMREHCTEPITRDDVAAAALMSPSHLSRMLREKLNRSYTELLAEMRVTEARRLLLHSNKSLAQVAAELGFSDQSYFTKVFKQHTGMTPSEYRRQRQHS